MKFNKPYGVDMPLNKLNKANQMIQLSALDHPWGFEMALNKETKSNQNQIDIPCEKRSFCGLQKNTILQFGKIFKVLVKFHQCVD